MENLKNDLADLVGQMEMEKIPLCDVIDSLNNLVTYYKKVLFRVRIDYLEGYEETKSKYFSLLEVEDWIDEDDLNEVKKLNVGFGVEIVGVGDRIYLERTK